MHVFRKSAHVGIGQAEVLTASTSKLANETSEHLIRCFGDVLV